jgi:hypothetical protein
LKGFLRLVAGKRKSRPATHPQPGKRDKPIQTKHHPKLYKKLKHAEEGALRRSDSTTNLQRDTKLSILDLGLTLAEIRVRI